MIPPKSLHLSICFFFFQLCLHPRLHPTRRTHGHQCVRRASTFGNQRGHYMQFWCRYCAWRWLRLGRSCVPRNPMPKPPPPPRVLCPPSPPYTRMAMAASPIASANASPTSPPLAMEELDDHPSAPTETVPPPPCSNTTKPSHAGIVNTRPVYGDDILAAVCHALTNGRGSPTAQLQHVESLLCDDWDRPLDVILPSSGSQQNRLEARHLRDVHIESYVTDSAEIVVYQWRLTRTALMRTRI